MQHKAFRLRLCFIFTLILFFGPYITYPSVYQNWGDVPFTPPPPTGGLKVVGSGTDNVMAGLIQTGAGYVLKAHSDFWLVLNKVEMSDPAALNYTELQVLVRSLRSNLASAISTYRNLKALADITPYNPDMIETLKQLDYNALNASRPHNASVWSEVEKYLIAGDVRGVFTKSLNDLETLSKMVDSVYYGVSNKIYPDIKALWSIGTVFCDSHLFGQYAAEIFSEL